MLREPVIVETGTDPTCAVIWLHGLGASGHDFEPAVPELKLPASSAVRFIFPHAPNIPVTVNGGMVMPAWYDILDMSIGRKVDEAGVRESAAFVHEILDKQIEGGIDSSRLVVAGFSQGGAVGYEAALSFPKPLAGLMTLSSYFPTATTLVPSAANAELPIAIYHGSLDPMVAESLGHQAAEIVRAMGHATSYQTYPMEHTVCLEQLRDIGVKLTEWLKLQAN